MSYVTRHQLTWNTEVPTREDFARQLAQYYFAQGDQPAQPAHINLELMHDVMDGATRVEWEQSDTHLALASAEYPDTVFSLDCQGEDGELHMIFVKNGRCLDLPYAPPPFDEADFAIKAYDPVM